MRLRGHLLDRLRPLIGRRPQRTDRRKKKKAHNHLPGVFGVVTEGTGGIMECPSVWYMLRNKPRNGLMDKNQGVSTPRPTVESLLFFIRFLYPVTNWWNMDYGRAAATQYTSGCSIHHPESSAKLLSWCSFPGSQGMEVMGVTNKSRINTFGDLMCPHSVICLVGPHKLESADAQELNCED